MASGSRLITCPTGPGVAVPLKYCLKRPAIYHAPGESREETFKRPARTHRVSWGFSPALEVLVARGAGAVVVPEQAFGVVVGHRLGDKQPSRGGQHAAIGTATERSATTRLKGVTSKKHPQLVVADGAHPGVATSESTRDLP